MIDTIDFELTAEAEALLLALCEEHQRRRECGSPRRSAAAFGTVEQIRQLLPGLWHPDDVFACCLELSRAGLLRGLAVNNTLEEIDLLDQAVIWYQQTGKRKFSETLDTLGRIRGIFRP